jgi:molybdate transport system substrate-binding protein
VVAAFKAEHPSVRVKINYGGSGALKYQVEEGAPVDLFFSAGMSPMEALVESGHIKEWTTVVENRLVLVVPDKHGQDIKRVEDLPKSLVQKIAIGQPETVPAGQYAKEVLEHLHLWDTVQEKIVYGKDVIQV